MWCVEDIDDAAGILGSYASSVSDGLGSVELPDISIATGGHHGHRRELLDLTSDGTSREEFLKRLWFRISGSTETQKSSESEEKPTQISKLFSSIGKYFLKNHDNDESS